MSPAHRASVQGNKEELERILEVTSGAGSTNANFKLKLSL